MIDTQTGDLLAVIRDAIDVPFPATDAARPAYLELCRDRGAAARSALDYALATGDLARATDLADEAIAAHPVNYPIDARWSARGMDAAVTG
ncbi:hypothetical protein [Nocardiopsis synnemataformans]|uniref:hypothetical protein n=1 Tax=Nocardiopsis synnemataformans TaxID=61305 RepID=UPI003EBF3439